MSAAPPDRRTSNSFSRSALPASLSSGTARKSSLTPTLFDDPFAAPQITLRPSASFDVTRNEYPSHQKFLTAGHTSSSRRSSLLRHFRKNSNASQSSINDLAPPTQSIKALNKLHLSTNSPKAVDVLTGIKIIRPLDSPSPGPKATTFTPSENLPYVSRHNGTSGRATLDDDTTLNGSEDDAPSSQARPVRTFLSDLSRRSSASSMTTLGINRNDIPSLPAKPIRPIQAKASPVLQVKSASAAKEAAPSPTSTANGLRTLACMYMVSGLPKDPAHWSRSELDETPIHKEDAVDAYFRVECLGTSVIGDAHDISELDADTPSRSKKTTHSKAELSPVEIARIQAKVMKLSFPKTVEIVSSSLAPVAAANFFHFSISNEADNASKPSTAWERNVEASRTSLTRDETVYYAASLEVWSHAAQRTQAIRNLLETRGSARAAMGKALKAASAGHKFSKILDEQVKKGGPLVLAETDVETEAFYSETDVETGRRTNPVKIDQPIWVPYALTLVSRYPLYDVMMDVLRVNYAKNHHDIARHSIAMSDFLNTPALKPGEMLKVAAGMDNVNFLTPFPYLMLSNSSVTLWPIFGAIGVDNLLTACEVALSPLGRIIVHSTIPILCSMAVTALKLIVEPKGWHGQTYEVTHARDIPIILDDSGPFLVGISSSCIPLTSKAAPDVLFLDVDADSATCRAFPPNLLSSGSVRESFVNTLERAIDRPQQASKVPREFQEAFPQGRFRPLSVVEASGRVTNAERLLPPTNWTFDQTNIFRAFDQVLQTEPARGWTRLFHKTTKRKLAGQTLCVLLADRVYRAYDRTPTQLIIRKHAAEFIDKRDLLEARIWRLNRKLAHLMNNTTQWSTQIDAFKRHASRQDVEGRDTKTRLSKERQESKRLSAMIADQQKMQEQLRGQLDATEAEREAALGQIEKLQQEQKLLLDGQDTKLPVETVDSEAELENMSRLDDRASAVSSPCPRRRANSTTSISTMSSLVASDNGRYTTRFGDHAMAIESIRARLRRGVRTDSPEVLETAETYSMIAEVSRMPSAASEAILDHSSDLTRTNSVLSKKTSTESGFVSARATSDQSSDSDDTAFFLGGNRVKGASAPNGIRRLSHGSAITQKAK